VQTADSMREVTIVPKEVFMSGDEQKRRVILQAVTMLPLMGSLIGSGQARAQTGATPVKVDTKGLVANKLRVTELTLAPGGHVGEHNHVGPGIRQVTSGYMTYVLPTETIVYGPGEFFFETGDINHTVFNKTDAPMVHVLFEILPVDHGGASLIPVKRQ
jgi:quercetin dioxygenase-like cupin family protein